jgi:hypothetical protein
LIIVNYFVISKNIITFAGGFMIDEQFENDRCQPEGLNVHNRR